MDCWISTDYQSRTGNMAYPCTNRKTADSYYLNRSYQLDRIAVLLFLRQGTNAAMAGYWSSKNISYIRKQYLYEYNSKHGRVQQKSIATLPKFPPSRRRFELLLTFTLCKLPIFFNSLITENPTAFIIYTLQLLADNLCSNHTKGYAVATISQIKKHPVLIWTITDKG